MRICLGVLSIVLLGHTVNGQKLSPEEYIETYKELAIEEMHRTGVPASITLSQGYLESGCGNSDLATKANNHFGIKCHDWKGPSYYLEDDDYDEEGNLTKSCFRKYKSPEQSYLDHSDFLANRSRYAFLFELRTNDYKGWARGLKKAGYATNPKYADLLISIIERYELYEYDQEKDSRPLVQKRLKKNAVFEINGIPAIAYNGQMTIRQLRDEYYFFEWQIFKYNDFERSTPLKKGMILYLKPKKRKNKVYETHTVQEGETMQYISQLRGIKLKRLYKLNQIEEGEQPLPGAKLSLDGKRAIKPAVKKSNPEYKYFLMEDEDELYTPQGGQLVSEGPVAERNEVEKENGLYHEVQSGETLLAIARAYKISPEALRAQNGLKDDNLQVGQLLLIEPRAESADASASEKDDQPETGQTQIEKPKTTETKTHMVAKGETLFSISRLYGLTVAELMDLNDLREPSVEKGAVLNVAE